MNNKRALSGGTMPYAFHPEDENWIDEQLCQLKRKSRESVCKLYGDVFSETMSKSIPDIKKSNQARKEANTRLRIYVGKCKDVLIGKVKKHKSVR